MAKIKKAFFCRSCGAESQKWFGKCAACGEWNTCIEEIVAKENKNKVTFLDQSERTRPMPLSEVENREYQRLDLRNGEVNRVLGGGLVPGSLVLLGGEPGIGKSTLSLQLALHTPHMKTLYVSGEESAQQIKMRGERIGVGADNCLVYAETNLEDIVGHMKQILPDVVIIDSIQTMYTGTIESSAGSVSQIRECAAILLKFAKETGVSVFIIGHITKDGVIAGPKILEHIVDVVLQFEGDNEWIHNIYYI